CGTSNSTGNITVTPVTDARSANTCSAATNEDTAVTIPAATLLANDTDVDGDTLTITSVQGATHGTVSLSGSNVVFTPAADYNGRSEERRAGNEGNGGSSTATANVTGNTAN